MPYSNATLQAVWSRPISYTVRHRVDDPNDSYVLASRTFEGEEGQSVDLTSDSAAQSFAPYYPIDEASGNTSYWSFKGITKVEVTGADGQKRGWDGMPRDGDTIDVYRDPIYVSIYIRQKEGSYNGADLGGTVIPMYKFQTINVE